MSSSNKFDLIAFGISAIEIIVEQIPSNEINTHIQASKVLKAAAFFLSALGAPSASGHHGIKAQSTLLDAIVVLGREDIIITIALS